MIRPMGSAEWAMLIVLSIIWGGSFLFFGLAVKELPVLTIAFLRVGLATAALWIIVLASRIPLAGTQWRNLLLMGLLNNAIPFSLIAWGQTEVPPGLAAIFNATTPFFTVLAANAFTSDEKLSAQKLAGAIIGLVGVASLIGFGAIGGSAIHGLAIMLAAIFYACAAIFGRRFAGQPPLVTAAGQTAGATLILLPLVIAFDQPWQLTAPSTTVIAAIVALALVCTSFAYVLFFTILKRSGSTNIALVTFLVPVSALLLGAVFLGEDIGLRHLAGMLAIGIGLALIDGRLLKRLRAAPSPGQ